jgi:hypothetical protein
MTERYNSILRIIAKFLTQQLKEKVVQIYVDIPGLEGCTHSTPFTASCRPDIVITWNVLRKRHMWIIELTVPSEDNFFAALERKTAKYETLIQEQLTTANPRYAAVTFTHIGIGACGVIEHALLRRELTRGLKAAGVSCTRYCTLFEQISIAALRGSIKVWNHQYEDVPGPDELPPDTQVPPQLDSEQEASVVADDDVALL